MAQHPGRILTTHTGSLPRPKDLFDMMVGGLADESAGDPVRIQGTILNAGEGHGQFWVSIEFGRGNVLVLSTYLVQIMEPFSLKALGLDIGAFEIMAIKSRFISDAASTTTVLRRRFCWLSRRSHFSERFIWTSSPMRTST